MQKNYYYYKAVATKFQVVMYKQMVSVGVALTLHARNTRSLGGSGGMLPQENFGFLDCLIFSESISDAFSRVKVERTHPQIHASFY